jgi:hypothetical protein
MINQTGNRANLVLTATVICSESGRVAGPRCREEYPTGRWPDP